MPAAHCEGPAFSANRPGRGARGGRCARPGDFSRQVKRRKVVECVVLVGRTGRKGGRPRNGLGRPRGRLRRRDRRPGQVFNTAPRDP